MNTPTQSFDFTSAVLSPLITFTRTGATATRINSSGFIENVAANTPRFDFTLNTGGACKGLLIEEQRSNLLLQSENFSAINWGKSAGVSVNTDAVLAPNNTQTADEIVFSGANLVINQFPVVIGLTISASIYLRGTAGQTILLSCGGTSTLVTLSNVWQRFVIQNITYVSGAPIQLSTFGGATARTIYVWGAQLESGSFATSYIPTVTSQVTRNADVATITGSNFSSFWQASKGGAQVQATPSTVLGIRPLVQFDDNTANEIIALRGNTTNPELYIVDGGTPQAQLDAGTIVANTAYSLTGWWATNDCKARQDSGAVVTDTTSTIPTVTQMRIGSDGTNYLNGTLATVNYYDSLFGQPIYTRRKNKVFSSLL